MEKNQKTYGSSLGNFKVKGSLTQKKELEENSNDEIPLDIKEEIIKKQEENLERAKKVVSMTKTYENAVNKWRPICIARNDYTAYSNKTLAMELGSGVLVQCIERDGNKMSMALQFIDGIKIIKNENEEVYTLVNKFDLALTEKEDKS